MPSGKLRSKFPRCQRKLLPSASKTVPNASPLVLKLSRKERLSHIDDYNVVQAFFAQDHKNHLFCYANANLMSDEQAAEVLRFAEYGKI